MQNAFLVLFLIGTLLANAFKADAIYIYSKGGFSDNDAKIALDAHNAARRSVSPKASNMRLVRALSDDDAKTALDAHNAARRSVSPPASNMRLMTWSSELAAVAQASAEGCTGQHTYNGYGENIFQTSSPVIDMAEAVASWVNEKKDYDYYDNQCTPGEICGHYTQVVWATSTEVGCGAVNNCGGEYTTHVYCNYKPAGNVNIDTTRPYKSGSACSGCTDCGFSCEDGLCVKGDTSNCEDCYTGDGTTYSGEKSTTVSGKKCVTWKSINNFMPDNNYCRNFFPNYGVTEPVCYYQPGSVLIERCGVPKCVIWGRPVFIGGGENPVTMYPGRDHRPSASKLANFLTYPQVKNNACL